MRARRTQSNLGERMNNGNLTARDGEPNTNTTAEDGVGGDNTAETDQ